MGATAPGIDVVTLAYIKGQLSGFTSTDATRDARITRLIKVISQRFESFLNRYIYAEERTEYFDVGEYAPQEYWVLGTPVTAAEVYSDSSREFAAATEVDSDYVFITQGGDSVQVLDYTMGQGVRVMKLVYTGGLAASTANISLTMAAGGTGDFTAGNSVYKDGVATVLGTVVSWSSTTKILVVSSEHADCEAMGLAVGDSVDEGAADPEWTISSISASNLIVTYPQIAQAAVAMFQYVWNSKDNIGQTSITVLEQSASFDRTSDMPQEVETALWPYRQSPRVVR